MNGEEQGAPAQGTTQAEFKRADKTIHDLETALDEHAIVAITDPKGKITYVNEKFCAISRYTREELIGRDHRILNSRNHPKPFFKTLWHTIQAGEIWRGDIENRRKDGASYWVDTTIVPFLDEHGNPEQYIAIRVDITERKRSDARLEEMAEKLKKKNQELEAVIYAVSHDLRSPLVNVQGFSSVIAGQVGKMSEILTKEAGLGEVSSQEMISEAQEEMEGALKFIQAGIAKIDTLLDGLLVSSRMDTTEVSVGDLDVAQVIEANLAAMKFQLEEADAEVVLGKLPRARGDYDLLGQVFTNLFGNALKFATPGIPLKLEISGEKSGGMIIYEVRDNGVGIAAAHQERIFEPFHRLNPGGTIGQGRGLAIVRKALDRMSGKIAVSSKVGQGSVFAVSLPA